MIEQQFLKTMIETVKYDEYDSKDKLLGILRNSIISFNKTSNFTQKTHQHWENIDLRVPIPMLKEARNLQAEFETLAAQIYIETSEYDFASLKIKPKLIDLENENNNEHDVVFDEIKDTIIQGIRNAKYTVWVAVAWFTDNEIFDELLLRKKAGVNVRVITSNEDSNNHLIGKLESNFDVKKIPKKGRYTSNMFHDKFCIIDLEYVMHGSYNWSKNARNNDETWATALDKDFVRKFAEEFLKLYTEH